MWDFKWENQCSLYLINTINLGKILIVFLFGFASIAGDLDSIPGSGRSPAEGNGNPLQYSCLENPMDRGTWQAIVHGVAKNQTRLRDLTDTDTDTHTYIIDNCWEPTAQHRELYSVFCRDLNGEEIQKRRDTYICLVDSLCCTAETNTTL